MRRNDADDDADKERKTISRNAWLEAAKENLAAQMEPPTGNNNNLKVEDSRIVVSLRAQRAAASYKQTNKPTDGRTDYKQAH